jgi:LacI family transcriptional regulator
MEDKGKITIRDIAKQAKVSIATVSRVLNDPDSVKVDNRQAVLAAIRDLDYQPNILAQRLAGGQSLTIGVITQFIHSPHFATMTRGIFQGLNGSGYSVIFVDGGFDPEVEHKLVQNLISRRIDGLIIMQGRLPNTDLGAINSQIPLVVIGRQVPELLDQCLWMNQFQAAYNATRFLIEIGHQEIAHIIGIPEHSDAVDRLEGYVQALVDSGLPVDPELQVQGDFLEQSGVMAVEMLLMRRRTFSAIFAANDQMAMGARLALYRRAIRVPEEVSIIGFDDQSQSAYFTPPLTTVRQPSFQMGEVGAKAMLRLLNGEPASIPQFSGELIVRESTSRRR